MPNVCKVACIFLWVIALGCPSLVQAAGFALIEQSASGMGEAYAGAAAVAEDASTIFFNPAGMTYLPDSQGVVAVHAIRPSIEFSNSGSQTGIGTPMSGNNGGDAGDWAFVPNLYFAKAVTERFRLGLGINAPFGLKTEYDDGWVGRYQALKTEFKTVNINPSLAFRVNNAVSLGAGVDYQRADATLTNAVDFGTICTLLQIKGTLPPGTCAASSLSPQANDGKATVTGDDWRWGYNLGAIFQLSSATRAGFSYRSEIRHKLNGKVSISGKPGLFSAGALGAPFSDSNISADITLPAIASISLLHRASEKWDVMADLTWTGWNSFNELRIVRSSGVLSGQPLSVQPENWRNAIRASLGASYQYSDTIKLRTGVAYDESPIFNAHLTPRIPDNDRIWISLGANYKYGSKSSLDIGYSHIFMKSPSLNIGGIGTPAGQLVGNYDSHIDMLSVQYAYNF